MLTSRSVRLATFLSICMAVRFAGAQTQPPSTPQAVPDTIKVTTRLVQVNVLVHDHKGKPVDDLKKEDFTVEDRGKPQTISIFTKEMRNDASSTANAKSSRVLPGNIVSNRPEESDGPTSVTVLLLDFYNTNWTDQVYAKQALFKFLRTIQPEDRIAIYMLTGGGFKIIHDFTNNSSTLLDAIAKAMPGISNQLGAPGFDGDADVPEIDNFLNSSTAMSAFFSGDRVINTCSAFKTLADHLASLPGRKNVIWLSDGFPITFDYGAGEMPGRGGHGQLDRQLSADYIEAASRAMNTANVAVYPVDAKGLEGLPMFDASRTVTPNPRTGQIPRSLTHVSDTNRDTMRYVADLTGGKAFYNTNDLSGAIRKAIEDSTVTYTLGYYVPEDDWDNKFHKISVKVDRPGVSVSMKKGYFAAERIAPSKDKLDQLLHDSVWSPLDSTSLGIAARLDPSQVTPNGTRVTFGVDAKDLQFQSNNGKFTGAVDIVVVQQTRQGKQLTDVKNTLLFTETPQQLAALQARGFEAGKDLAVNPQTEAIRVVVMDRNSGLTGSVTVPISRQDKSGPGPAQK